VVHAVRRRNAGVELNYHQGMQVSTISGSVAVAYSGGADSTALLMLCAQQNPGRVQAIHIHHGLQAAADDFAAHCTAFCKLLQVPLHVVYVQAAHAAGDSPEDAARTARYSALVEKFWELKKQAPQLKERFLAIDSIAIAQHADDQIETMLLALSRGAGLSGLSAMPARWQRDGVDFVRPLLKVSAQEIRKWLASQGMVARHPGRAHVGQGWVEDPTNTDIAFTRNRIRHVVMPALQDAFPQFRATFARSASHAAQAQRLLVQVAAEDLHAVGDPPSIEYLQALGSERQANLLRHWLKSVHGVVASTAQLDELQSQIQACTNRGKQIHIKVATGFVLRHESCLVYMG
jgi:tRNA(Ile)-lysidine synthase